MLFTPDLNNGKNIFVYGSNLAGRNGKGAALTAQKFWGAKYGVGSGRTGQAYAIPTKDEHLNVLSLTQIKAYVKIFLIYAEQNSSLTFLVTPVGTGLAGYKEEDIKPLPMWLHSIDTRYHITCPKCAATVFIT